MNERARSKQYNHRTERGPRVRQAPEAPIGRAAGDDREAKPSDVQSAARDGPQPSAGRALGVAQCVLRQLLSINKMVEPDSSEVKTAEPCPRNHRSAIDVPSKKIERAVRL